MGMTFDNCTLVNVSFDSPTSLIFKDCKFENSCWTAAVDGNFIALMRRIVLDGRVGLLRSWAKIDTQSVYEWSYGLNMPSEEEAARVTEVAIRVQNNFQRENDWTLKGYTCEPNPQLIDFSLVREGGEPIETDLINIEASRKKLDLKWTPEGIRGLTADCIHYDFWIGP